VLDRSLRASLRIYDVRGRLVRALLDGVRGPGTHPVTWNGEDAAGARVPGGVYFLRFEAGDRRETRKLVILRGR
jgi:flagellar hook assembly protein FlgD